jgi:hypothetical protein
MCVSLIATGHRLHPGSKGTGSYARVPGQACGDAESGSRAVSGAPSRRHRGANSPLLARTKSTVTLGAFDVSDLTHAALAESVVIATIFAPRTAQWHGGDIFPEMPWSTSLPYQQSFAGSVVVVVANVCGQSPQLAPAAMTSSTSRARLAISACALSSASA